MAGMSQAPFRLKRAYEPASPEDGFRVLVDRLWPRGLTREKAQIDLWPKDIAPSDELRRRFHSDPRPPQARWDDFRDAYFAELAQAPARAAAEVLKAQTRSGPVTLLYAAKDEHWNNAVALKAWLEGRG
jgi:uncharacterized protein YeaO (DUF488 family)